MSLLGVKGSMLKVTAFIGLYKTTGWMDAARSANIGQVVTWKSDSKLLPLILSICHKGVFLVTYGKKVPSESCRLMDLTERDTSARQQAGFDPSPSPLEPDGSRNFKAKDVVANLRRCCRGRNNSRNPRQGRATARRGPSYLTC